MKDLQRRIAFAYLLMEILQCCRIFCFTPSDEGDEHSKVLHASISFFTPW